jgi:hypothetical protein
MSLLRAAVALLATSALAVGCGGDRADCNCPATPPRGCVYTGRQGCACAAMVCSDIGPAIDLGDAVTDAGAVDTGAVDAGAVDTGAVDTGAVDTGAVDTGTVDAGSRDADDDEDGSVTFVDRPAVDAAEMDAAETDALETDALEMDAADAARADGSRPDVESVDAPRDDAGLLRCPPAPSDRACSTDAECVLGFYSLNCVGEQRAVAFNSRASVEFRVIQACWALATAEMLRCSDRASRGTEVEQTGRFVTDPATLEVSCRGGQCAATVH